MLDGGNEVVAFEEVGNGGVVLSLPVEMEELAEDEKVVVELDGVGNGGAVPVPLLEGEEVPADERGTVPEPVPVEDDVEPVDEFENGGTEKLAEVEDEPVTEPELVGGEDVVLVDELPNGGNEEVRLLDVLPVEMLGELPVPVPVPGGKPKEELEIKGP